MIGEDGRLYAFEYKNNVLTDELIEDNRKSYLLTDGQGRTLYRYVNDKAGTNNYTILNFTNDSARPIYESSVTSIHSNLDPSDFNVIDVFGKKQLTFRGWPLYYYGKDKAKGDTKGISEPSPGVWLVINENTPEAPVE